MTSELRWTNQKIAPIRHYSLHIWTDRWQRETRVPLRQRHLLMSTTGLVPIFLANSHFSDKSHRPHTGLWSKSTLCNLFRDASHLQPQTRRDLSREEKCSHSVDDRLTMRSLDDEWKFDRLRSDWVEKTSFRQHFLQHYKHLKLLFWFQRDDLLN